MKTKLYLFTLIFSLFAVQSQAANGDTTHIITHNLVTVVTNPSAGSNGYKAWGVFPASSLPLRKVFVTMKYKCPGGMACGEWDYIDQVVVRRKGGKDSASLNTEIVRFITPYGNSFSSTWNFSWHIDITDYKDMLRDSVEIEYIHTGYETNVGKGWAVTLDFNFIEGDPVANLLSFQQLWEGSFQYGNAANDIELNLQPINFTSKAACNFTKLRILHTGHGSDDNGCSEFCDKYRRVKFDGTIVNTRNRWRTCGNNALYPQGGTWVYDRGNWCPGSVIFPDFITNAVAGNTAHTYDIDMQVYTGSGSYGNENINAQLFQYAAPNKSLDASIEELIRPSSLPEYSRLNPICTNPQILIRNNGSTALSSVNIKYGFTQGTLQNYTWTGNLNFGDTASVQLPNLVWTTAANGKFVACINTLNGQADQYRNDDTARTSVVLPPVYDSVFIIHFYTNNYPAENSYTLSDAAGNIIKSRNGTQLTAQYMCKDTVHLQPGCYSLKIYDTGGDGLSFWANTAQGSGQFKLKKLNTPSSLFFKYFTGDFGNFTYQDFIVNPAGTSISTVEQPAPYFIVYPNPASDKINVEFDLSDTDSGTLTVLNVLGENLYRQNLKNMNANVACIDTYNYPDGIYVVKLIKNNQAYTRKVIVSR